MKHYFDKRENILILTILMLTIMVILVDSLYIYLLLFWIVIQLINGNARRLYFNRCEQFFIFIRRSLYIFPLWIPILFLDEISYSVSFIGLIITLILCTTYLYIKWSEIRIFSDKEYLKMTIDKTKFQYSMDVYTLLGAAISEEIFFRLFILEFYKNNIIFSMIISVILFWALHYCTKWGESFDVKDSINQIVFSIISVVLYVLFDSIIYSVIIHIMFNMQMIYLNILKINILSEEK